MKTESKKTGNGTKNAQAALAEINTQIEALTKQRVSLAEPLKDRHAELRSELLEVEDQIRNLDPTWKPASLRPKAEDRITAILTEKGQPMTPEEIVQAVGDLFTPWKVKNTLKKKSTGPKAVFTVADGRYSVRPVA
jgi:DNA-directed RNA polymerase subunit F